jgi:hypothetical protein
MDIKSIMETYLDRNTLPEGYSIESWVETSKNCVQTVGNITLVEESTKMRYLVDFKSLVSLHGSGVDDLNVVTGVSVIGSTS